MQARVFVSGFVQGVGYRQFVKSYAKKLGHTGWVRNSLDGKVEIVLQGDKAKIEALLSHLRKGPFLAEVKDVQVEWEEEKEQFRDFTISGTSK